MKMALDSQTVSAKENLKFSHGGPSQSPVSDTDPWTKALCPDRHWIWGLTHRCAIREETIYIWIVIGFMTNHADCHLTPGCQIRLSFCLKKAFQQLFWIYNKILALKCCVVAEQFSSQRCIKRSARGCLWLHLENMISILTLFNYVDKYIQQVTIADNILRCSY